PRLGVPFLPSGPRMPVRRVHRAPFSLASDGTLLVNAAEFDGSLAPRALLQHALKHSDRVFIGIPVSATEEAAVIDAAHDGLVEASARIAGQRQKRRWATAFLGAPDD